MMNVKLGRGACAWFTVWQLSDLAERGIHSEEVALPEGLSISGVVLADHVKSAD